ncbi:putative RNA polymerase sigma factor FecI [bacterium HR17]|uniref:Putative RNA polymerase sigma factor FecI n=1 Tax=Candidatus Fervidibacter japonicus TaxID=2035412 RepID=A0A2H5XEM8_9BACT|nr:putative RNA polymerase sigma factor FecI [bacterium HR17]
MMACPHGSRYRNASEADLLEWFYACDNTAFEELFECRWRPWLTRWVAMNCEDKEDVQDIVQEVALKVVQTKHRPSTRYNPQRGQPRLWLLAIAKHEIVNLLRRKGKPLIGDFLEQFTEEGGEVEIPDPMELMEQMAGISDAAAEELRALVRTAVRKLEEPSRTIVRLHFWDGYTLQEIGAQFNMSLATVHRRLAHDLKHLRELLAD